MVSFQLQLLKCRITLLSYDWGMKEAITAPFFIEAPCTSATKQSNTTCQSIQWINGRVWPPGWPHIVSAIGTAYLLAHFLVACSHPGELSLASFHAEPLSNCVCCPHCTLAFTDYIPCLALSSSGGISYSASNLENGLLGFVSTIFLTSIYLYLFVLRNTDN